MSFLRTIYRVFINDSTLTNFTCVGGSPGESSEELVTQEERKGWRMNCDVGEATEGLENEQVN